jgi:hypothetical protein
MAQQMDRRTMLRRSALTGGALVWATPVVQTLARPAYAQTFGSPQPLGEPEAAIEEGSVEAEGELQHDEPLQSTTSISEPEQVVDTTAPIEAVVPAEPPPLDILTTEFPAPTEEPFALDLEQP